ncbi:endolytic transglycosylase MltG [Thorsellia kenyensis]|uniref:Endolytic murein transglycosylase n=1 Tax=Thorsellia kenyensis TaxID=1549888 RepID=A0ABV6CC92_9GAMM
MKKKLFVLSLFALLAILAIANMTYQNVKQLAEEKILIKEERLFTIEPGTGRVALGELLVQDKIMDSDSAQFLQWLLRLEPELAKIKAGTFRLMPGMSTREMLMLFVSGKEAQFTIQFIEGTRLSDALETLKKAPNIKHTLEDYSDDTLRALFDMEGSLYPEGMIYPDTYNYTFNTSDKEILLRANRALNKTLDEAWESRQKELPYKDKYELLIMASIIEKETAVSSERNKVASVFVNRLNKNMRLQTDPTVIYGMGSQYQGNIRKKDLETSTPYNTYTIEGLPPTPISLVAKESIQAAANPANTNYLYFVADGKGGHVFNENLQAHNKSVRDYLKTLKN